MSAKITKSSTVGVFATRDQAQQAVNELRSMGFTNNHIGLIAKDDAPAGTSGARSGLANDPTHTRWEEGTGIGAAAGAATGTGLGLAVAAGLLTPVGPIIAGGALVALLASAGAGATVGTLVGGLIGLGVPEGDAEFYEGEVKSGRYLVTVDAAGRETEVKSVFQRFQAYDRTTAAARLADRADTAGRTTASASTAATATAAGQTVKLHEERLQANKETVQAGQVGIRKEVRTEQKTITVPVEREELVIERHAVNATGRAGDIRAEEIRIPLKEERVTVGKETVVKEEVTIGKRTVGGTQTVAGDVRTEELIVETDGKAKVTDGKVTKKS